MHRENGAARATVYVRKGERVVFFVKEQLKTEEELKKINPSTLGSRVSASDGGNTYYKDKLVEKDKRIIPTIAFNE